MGHSAESSPVPANHPPSETVQRVDIVRNPTIPKRFYEPRVDAILAQHNTEFLRDKIATLRQLVHQINWITAAVVRLAPEPQRAYLTASLIHLLPQAHDQLWELQTGSPNQPFDPEDFDFFPPRIRERRTKSWIKRFERLSPFVILDAQRTPLAGQPLETAQYLELVSQAVALYDQLETALGLTPAQMLTPETIALQRVLRWQDRLLIAQMKFIQAIITCATESTNPREVALAGVVTHMAEINEWYGTLMRFSLQELQSLLSNKISHDQKKLQYIQDNEMWEDLEFLRIMLMPRELRELVMQYYGLFRSSATDETSISGYHFGQLTLVLVAKFVSSLPPEEH